MKLTVITATRGNVTDHLIAAVRSVRAVEAQRQHILVCPAHKRSHLEIAFPHCHVVVEKSTGLYAALNDGRRAANRDGLFTWLNDDDVLIQPGFNRAMARLANDPTLAIIYGRVTMVDFLSCIFGQIPVAHRPADLPALMASGLMPLAQPGTIFKWSVADRVGDFDPDYRLAGDLDFFARAVRAGFNFAFHDEEVAWFRLQEGQLSKDAVAAAIEHARAIERLPRIPAAAARRRFRWDNRWVYWDRIRRHGFKRMNTLYRHA